MRSSLPVGAEARREIAAILAGGILTFTKHENQRQIVDNKFSMTQSYDHDVIVSNQGGIDHE